MLLVHFKCSKCTRCNLSNSTGVDKFAALSSEAPDVSSNEVMNELNEKLEERLFLTED